MRQRKDLPPDGGVHHGPPGTKPGVVKRRVAITPTPKDKVAGRQAPNPVNLYTWRSYKTWLEKVRRSWEEKK
jgi:hypothetical protein